MTRTLGITRTAQINLYDLITVHLTAVLHLKRYNVILTGLLDLDTLVNELAVTQTVTERIERLLGHVTVCASLHRVILKIGQLSG